MGQRMYIPKFSFVTIISPHNIIFPWLGEKKIMLCFLFPAGWELRLRPGGREIYFFINYFFILRKLSTFPFLAIEIIPNIKKVMINRKLMSKWANIIVNING